MIPPCGHGGATLGSLRPLIGQLMLISARSSRRQMQSTTPFPTIEEVEHAIQLLGAAGLVRYSDNSLQLTDEGRRVCGLRRMTSSPPSTVYTRS
jgi:hypothetical protein